MSTRKLGIITNVAIILGTVIVFLFIIHDAEKGFSPTTQPASTQPTPEDGKWTPEPLPRDVLLPDGIGLVNWRQNPDGTNTMEYRDPNGDSHAAEFKFVPIPRNNCWAGENRPKVRVELLPGTTRPGIDAPE